MHSGTVDSRVSIAIISLGTVIEVAKKRHRCVNWRRIDCRRFNESNSHLAK